MKLVLVSLADQSNSDGVCWPGMQFIADRTGLNKSTVLRNVRKLAEHGYLDINKRVGGDGGGARSNVYTLKIAKVTPSDVRSHVSESDSVRTEPPLEPSLVYIRARGIEQEYKNFKAMRKQIKKPMNATSEKMLISKLEKLESTGLNPADLLDNATANCWLSVYQPKEKQNGHERRNGQSKATLSTPQSRNAAAQRDLEAADAGVLAENDGHVW